VSTRLYTIGHSNVEPEEFFDRLKRFDIEVLIDIRSAPYCRYARHFNKEKIERLCKRNGIEYRYLGNLVGGKPDDPTIVDGGGNIDYELLAEKDYFRSGIREVLDVAKKSRACLMCSEGEPDKCHRSLLVAPALETADAEVVHILPDGTTVTCEQLRSKISRGQMTLF